MAKEIRRRSKTKKTKNKWTLGKICKLVGKSILYFFIGTILITILYKFVFPPLTPLQFGQFFKQVFSEKREVRFKRDYVPIEDISPRLVVAVVAAEDGYFMRHNGFDFDQIVQSKKENEKRHKSRIRGGSTISMQTAKNAFLPHHRNYVRKAFEAYFTILIENIWGKKRIMEVYLNIIEFGDGIYGCEAASQYYFHKPASNLTQHEAALLASVLPSPRKSNPANPSRYIRNRASNIQNRMQKYGRINLDKKLPPRKNQKTWKDVLEY